MVRATPSGLICVSPASVALSTARRVWANGSRAAGDPARRRPGIAAAGPHRRFVLRVLQEGGGVAARRFRLAVCWWLFHGCGMLFYALTVGWFSGFLETPTGFSNKTLKNRPL